MPTLYVENVPEDLYEAIRARSHRNRTSISTEVLALLAENVPSPKVAAQRKKLVERARRWRSRPSSASGPFPSAEQMLREDRER